MTPSLPTPVRATDEFPPGAASWPRELSRRDFLQLMGASLALAGLAGCGRAPREKMVTYVTPPEKNPAPGAAWYATAMPYEGYARGVLAKTVEGRPIKLEGNPDHPESLGAADAVTQAAILSLYDPDRSRTLRRHGEVATWDEFALAWRSHAADQPERRGAGIALLTEPTTSPTLRREIAALLQARPALEWYQHTPLSRHDRDGASVDFDFAAADFILSIGSDVFFQHPAALRYVRGFSTRRRDEKGGGNFNRFHAVEPTLTLTGALADRRLALAPGRIAALLAALAVEIGRGAEATAGLTAAEKDFVRETAVQLQRPNARCICVVGAEMPEEFQQWGEACNRRFGGGAVRWLPAARSDGDPGARGGLAEFCAALQSGRIGAAWVLGGNPVATAPGRLDVAAALRRANFTVHLGGHLDETAATCDWHVPEAHFLESWSDLRAYSGGATLVQPLVEPDEAVGSVMELVRFLATGERKSGHDLVQETWRDTFRNDFDLRWHAALQRGIVEDTAGADAIPAPREFPRLAPGGDEGVTILLRPDANVLDGRWANNPWLQELPRPFIALVWENAALIDPGLAAELSVKNGDFIRCELNGRTVDAPVWILRGQAPRCVTLPLGYGRRRAGGVGTNRGFDGFPLRDANDRWQWPRGKVERTGRHRGLVSTQGHFTMEGRDLARTMAAKDLARSSQLEDEEHPVSLFPRWPREGYAWAMAIDLSTCYGCNACVVACQAENNIPVVGRDQVARGREMHWIRIDTYFTGEPDRAHLLHQPVPCMHCESAPCEEVCPVGATVHSSEGLNDMVYNRCVGTRYCSNNCPYKVRRFNFLDYRQPADSPVYLQANPDVTVRERGVMEKCTYCVQRISAARITAEKENRRIRDGELRTACQQACPAEAIVFGDLNDPASRVARRRHDPAAYFLLGELGTRPRTSYLARILPDGAAPAKGGAA